MRRAPSHPHYCEHSRRQARLGCCIPQRCTARSSLTTAFRPPAQLLPSGICSREVLVQDLTPFQFIQLAALGNATAQPGVGQEYSNTGFVLLGLLLEKLFGAPVDQLMQGRIFGPLGMQDTLFPPPSWGGLLPDGTLGARGYWWLPSAQAPDCYDPSFPDQLGDVAAWNTNQAWTAGAVVSTGPDMLKLAKALQTGQLYKNGNATLELQLQGFDSGFPGYRYALRDFTSPAAAVLGHGGQTVGFKTEFCYSPTQDWQAFIAQNEASVSVLSCSEHLKLFA